MKKYIFHSHSPAVTSRLGQRMGKQFQAGSVIALIGELGCGKTLLTRGICAGLDVPLRRVNSPSFVLVNEYSGRLPVFHMDLYRLGEIADGFEIGLLDYLARAEYGIMVVEWAEKILSLLPYDRLEVRFHIMSARQRQIELSASDDKFGSLFRELEEQ
jgi:tRNA threonylcarbamoyladenosine biosynthesis protein TsaE